MTEYEAVEAAQSLYANSTSMFALFLTIISSYLIVAYLVGNKLTPSQATIATALFLVSAIMTMTTLAALFDAGIHYSNLAAQLREDDLVATTLASRKVVISVIIADACFILASLKFMWDVRHPKKK